MPTRFSFTKEQFAAIKRMQAEGKTSRQVSERFNLGETTLRKIKRARTYEDYRRNQQLKTFWRKKREAQAAAARKRTYLTTIWTLVVLLGISLALLGAF